MKALRITCFLGAAYYGLHTGLLFFTGYITHFTQKMLPEGELMRNPMLQMQAMTGDAAIKFAPYLLIGVPVCLLMGFFMKPLWKIIPVVAVMLFIAGIVWAIAYYFELQPYYNQVGSMMKDMPGMGGMLGKYVHNSMNVGQYAGSYPVLIPGFVIFLFWWKSRKEKDAVAAL